MEAEKVKEWLERGQRVEERIAQLTAEKQAAFERATSIVPSGSGSPVKNSGNNRSAEAYAIYAAEIDEKISRLVKTKREIQHVISGVKRPELQQLLYARYIRCETWEQIAAEMHYSVRHVNVNLHAAALEAAGEILETLQ